MNSKLNTTEQTKLRYGTRCQFCGELILDNDYITCHGGALGNVIYAHQDCCQKHNYSYKNDNTFHKRTQSGFAYGVEWETNTITTDEERLFLRACYGLICTSDCTVAEEFKSPITYGLHGVKTIVEGISKVIDIYNGENCGSHINFSLGEWEYDFMAKINAHTIILQEYARFIYSLSVEQRIQLFGRDFTNYSMYSDSIFEHGYFIALKPFGFELRIARAKNLIQFTNLLMYCKEFALIFNDAFNNKISDTLAIKRLKTLTINHLNGRAKYQSESRNNYIR